MKPTPLQTARRENEMRRIIVSQPKPQSWRDLILSPAEVSSLIAKGVIKTMPAPIKQRAGRVYRVKYATEAERKAAKVEAKKRWTERNKATK